MTEQKNKTAVELIQTIAYCVKAAGVRRVILVADPLLQRQSQNAACNEIITVLQKTAIDRFQSWSLGKGFSDID